IDVDTVDANRTIQQQEVGKTACRASHIGTNLTLNIDSEVGCSTLDLQASPADIGQPSGLEPKYSTFWNTGAGFGCGLIVDQYQARHDQCLRLFPAIGQPSVDDQ